MLVEYIWLSCATSSVSLLSCPSLSVGRGKGNVLAMSYPKPEASARDPENYTRYRLFRGIMAMVD